MRDVSGSAIVAALAAFPRLRWESCRFRGRNPRIVVALDHAVYGAFAGVYLGCDLGDAHTAGAHVNDFLVASGFEIAFAPVRVVILAHLEGTFQA